MENLHEKTLNGFPNVSFMQDSTQFSQRDDNDNDMCRTPSTTATSIHNKSMCHKLVNQYP